METIVLVRQFVALSLYALWMGYCFCDGFRLHIARKLSWYAVFFLLCFYTLKTRGEFDIAYILPIMSLLAFLFCVRERTVQRKQATEEK